MAGATGFIGSEVVAQLAAAANSARVMARWPSRARPLAGLDVEPSRRLTSVPRRLAPVGASVAGTVLGRSGPTMVAACWRDPIVDRS